MLVKGQSRLDARKYYFSPKRTVNEWNEMSYFTYFTCFTYICGLSISERLPCPESFEILLGCQSC